MKKTNLGKRVHVYRSLKDMEIQFASDVETMGKKFSDLIVAYFDPVNPWDQSVMVAIMTNILAFVEVWAELGGDNLEKLMKELYEDNLKEYRKQLVKKQ